jgi:two-component system sensor kinase FixL
VGDALETALDAVADGLLVIDESGSIVEVNRAASSLLGYTLQELEGRSLASLIPELVEPARPRQEAGSLLGAGYRGEVLALRKDGRPIRLELAVEAGREQDRVFLVALLHDLSEQMRHERLVHRRRELLARTLVVTSLAEAAATITHDLNQPLAAITNYADAGRRILERDPSQSHSVLSILEKIAAQASRAGEELRRFRRLLDRRPEEGQGLAGERIDLNRLLCEVTELVALEAAGEPPLLELDLDPRMPWVEGRRLELQAVVLGLVRAAVEANVDEPLSLRTRCTGSQRVAILVTASAELAPTEGDERPSSAFLGVGRDTSWMGTEANGAILATHGGELSVERDEDGRAVYRCELPLAAVDEPTGVEP